jgi:hypothetical protein
MGTFWGAIWTVAVVAAGSLLVVVVFALAFKAIDQWFSE